MIIIFYSSDANTDYNVGDSSTNNMKRLIKDISSLDSDWSYSKVEVDGVNSFYTLEGNICVVEYTDTMLYGMDMYEWIKGKISKDTFIIECLSSPNMYCTTTHNIQNYTVEGIKEIVEILKANMHYSEADEVRMEVGE